MGSTRGEESAEERVAGWSTEDLEARARAAEGGECYDEFSRGDDYRVGVVATAYPSSCVVLALEVSLRLCRADGEVDSAFLEEAAKLSRVLRRRGYSVNHLDEGWIVCEKSLRKEDIAAERAYLLTAFRPAGKKPRLGADEPGEDGAGSGRRSGTYRGRP